MYASRRCAIVACAIVVASTAIESCSGSRAASTTSAPPKAEFLLSSADSTFWVATTGGRMRVRGVPLVLARYSNRFFELYSADDDQS